MVCELVPKLDVVLQSGYVGTPFNSSEPQGKRENDDDCEITPGTFSSFSRNPRVPCCSSIDTIPDRLQTPNKRRHNLVDGVKVEMERWNKSSWCNLGILSSPTTGSSVVWGSSCSVSTNHGRDLSGSDHAD